MKIILTAIVVLLIVGFIYPRFLRKSAPTSISMHNFHHLMYMRDALVKYKQSKFPNSIAELAQHSGVDENSIAFHDLKTNEKLDWIFLGAGKKFDELANNETILSSPEYFERDHFFKIEIQKQGNVLEVVTLKIK